jgi:putative ABC transport system permease protein
VTAALHRVRAFAGQLALLAALAVVAALLVTGVPRVANGYTDAGLRADLAGLPYTVRDLTLTGPPAPSPDQVADRLAVDGGEQLDAYRARLPGPIPGLADGQWYTARVGPAGVDTGGTVAPFRGACPPSLSVRTLSGADRAIRVVEGRAPASARAVEAMLPRPAAAALGVRTGATFTLTGLLGPVPVRVVGVFEQLDPAAPMWAGMPLTQTSCPNPADGVRAQAGLLTDAPGIRLAAVRTGELVTEWRYRLDETKLTAAGVPALATAVAAARRDPPLQTHLVTGLDATLARYAAQQDAVAALLAVVQAGVIATLLGLLLLAAALVVERRRTEFALIRARGGGVGTVAGRLLAETALVAPAAVLAGWLAGAALPGRPAPHGWLPLLMVAATATLTAPVLAAVAQRHPAFTGRRRDVARTRRSVRRLVGEMFVVLLAALGVVLVRRRGLDAADGVDPYLVAVPGLLAVAVALIVLRVLPWPLRLAGRVATRARGAVPFLGLAGAGRGSVTHLTPLAVLVVAVATGVFTGAVTATIRDARDRAADHAVPGDALITGAGFSAGTAQRLATVPGVTAVAPMWTGSSSPLGAREPDVELIRVHVVDGPAADRVPAQQQRPPAAGRADPAGRRRRHRAGAGVAGSGRRVRRRRRRGRAGQPVRLPRRRGECRGAGHRRRRAAVRGAARSGVAGAGRSGTAVQPVRDRRSGRRSGGVAPGRRCRAARAHDRCHRSAARRVAGAADHRDHAGGVPGVAGERRRQPGAQLHLRGRRGRFGRARGAHRRLRRAGRGAGPRGGAVPAADPRAVRGAGPPAADL